MPKRKATPAEIKNNRNLKRYRHSMAALEKNFKLGLITEEKYGLKKNKLLIRVLIDELEYLRISIADTEKIIRKEKASLNRKTQRVLVYLANGHDKDTVMQCEQMLLDKEELIKNLIALNTKMKSAKKEMETLLKQLTS